MQQIMSYVILIAALAVVRGLGSGAARSPMERAFYDVIEQQRLKPARRYARDTRTAPEGVPCVTVSFLTELKKRFIRWLDHNNDGVSTFNEVKDYLGKFKPDVKDQVVESFIRRRDLNGNGAIDFVPEYVHDLSVPDYTLEGATEWFNLQDTNDDGFVTEKELLDVGIAVGMAPEEAEEVVKGYYMVADENKDGRLSFTEFKTLYNQ